MEGKNNWGIILGGLAIAIIISYIIYNEMDKNKDKKGGGHISDLNINFLDITGESSAEIEEELGEAMPAGGTFNKIDDSDIDEEDIRDILETLPEEIKNNEEY